MSGSFTRTPQGSPSRAQSFKIDPQTGNVMCGQHNVQAKRFETKKEGASATRLIWR